MGVLIGRRLSDIAAIPAASKENEEWFVILRRSSRIGLRFIRYIGMFSRGIVLGALHFSIEKTLRKIRILALKVENFSARKLEEMHTYSQGIPHFNFFEDFKKTSKK